MRGSPHRTEIYDRLRLPADGADRRLAGARTTAILAILMAAFLFRVLAQLVQAISPTPFLPEFDAWQGSGVSYPVLLASQILILGAMAWVIRRRAERRRVFAPWLRRPVAWLGFAYLLAMAIRLLAGLTILSDVAWFARPLPAIFHLVLAGFLLIALRSDRPTPRKAGAWRRGETDAVRCLVRIAAYPAVMIFSFGLFGGLASAGLSHRWATMVAVAVAAGLVTAHELFWPHRDDWRPGRRDVANDLLFLALVQMILPPLLGFLLVSAAATLAEGQAAVAIWPHHWPAPAQMVLMLLVADFLRYWLHRAAHNYRPVWRFHAVHHAPKHLYALNVGRFHPIDKTLQYAVDALPFLLIGVHGEVLSLYFVFYAVNGFYQHCNGDIRLGPLNYLISGPELHRWHHSRLPRESNANYGNNLIVWDLLFGTYFRPAGRVVGELGLVNRDYPQGFLSQMWSPFVSGLDRTGGE